MSARFTDYILLMTQARPYSFVPSTKKRTIGCVSVSPHNPDHVIAGFGWRDDYDFLWVIDGKVSGKGQITVSKDGGKTWTEVTFAQKTEDRNVWTVSFDPSNDQIIYLSTGGGAYKSSDAGATWSMIPSPENTARHTGLAVSPNGKVLYATYASSKDNDYSGAIYASSTKDIRWQKVIQGDGLQLRERNYWYPEVDSRSEGEDHKLMIGQIGQRDGLFEGKFSWSGDELKSYSWDVIWKGLKGYDHGWDFADPNPRVAHYTPKSWARGAWSTTNQTIFQADFLADGTWQWNNKYSKPSDDFVVDWNGMKFKTYSGRGTESTYTYDVTTHENYVIQGQADNGLVESWDYGHSWSNMQHRNDSMNYSDVQSVAIAEANGVPTVVAQATGGYGGGAVDGRILVKKLIKHSPEDKWMFLGGGPNQELGLANGIFREVAVAPSNPSKVYTFSNEKGMYMIEDLGKAIEAKENGQVYNAVKISNGVLDKVKTSKKIAVHPTNENIVFLTGTTGKMGVYKGVNNNGVWTWSKVYKGHSWEAEVAAWEHEGKVYLVYAGASNEKHNDKCHFVIALSEDEGKTWRRIFDKDMAKEIRGEEANEAWYPHIEEEYTFQSKGGIAAKGSTIICNYYNHKFQSGFGLFKGTMQPDGQVTWENWTDDLHFAGVTSGMFAKTKGKWYYYISTPGAGAWRREATWLNK